jgi:RNA polymerase sigma factor (sigma-70 family)
MTASSLGKVLKHLRQARLPAGDGLTDGQLLARFVAGRDEAAFETLVHRHGPMVLGLCRRVLRDDHDAEDAFQGTFLILARKAGTVVKGGSVGSWLYAVAYHAALEARAAKSRRRAREKQVDEMPHPLVEPTEAQDWRPLLDHELAALPEKYRAAVVLCELEGLPRREAARRLGVPEGTLSSRLATARRKLAERLARLGVSGVCLPAGALAVALAGEVGQVAQAAQAAQAVPAVPAVPAALVSSTVRAATLVAAGEMAAVATLATPAVALMKGALQAMFIQKLKKVAVMAVVVLALGVGGLAYRAGGQTPGGDRPQAGKPRTEVEALRREVELLRLNLEVVLEKVRAQEAELRAFRGQAGRGGAADAADAAGRAGRAGAKNPMADPNTEALNIYRQAVRNEFRRAETAREKARHELENARKIKPDNVPSDPVRQAEEALRALRTTQNPQSQQRAAEALERALQKLRSKSDREKPK